MCISTQPGRVAVGVEFIFPFPQDSYADSFGDPHREIPMGIPIPTATLPVAAGKKLVVEVINCCSALCPFNMNCQEFGESNLKLDYISLYNILWLGREIMCLFTLHN